MVQVLVPGGLLGELLGGLLRRDLAAWSRGISGSTCGKREIGFLLGWLGGRGSRHDVFFFFFRLCVLFC